MPESITISKTNFYILCVAVALLCLALLIIWSKSNKEEPPIVVKPDPRGQLIKDKVSVPISPKLKKFLTDGNYKSIFLVREDARVKTIDQNGDDLEPCAIVENGEIKPVGKYGCPFKGIDVLNMHAIWIGDVSWNPQGPCHWVGGVLECNY